MTFMGTMFHQIEVLLKFEYVFNFLIDQKVVAFLTFFNKCYLSNSVT